MFGQQKKKKNAYTWIKNTEESNPLTTYWTFSPTISSFYSLLQKVCKSSKFLEQLKIKTVAKSHDAHN